MRNRKQNVLPDEQTPKTLKHGKIPLSALDSALGMDAPASPKKGMKKIATSNNRKKLDTGPLDTGPYKKQPVEQQDSNFSVSSNGSYCNDSCEKTGSSEGRISPHSALSNRDSGLDCHKQVTQQNSNGSVHIEKFEQALKDKLANRSENREKKSRHNDEKFETAAQRFRRATAEVTTASTLRYTPKVHDDIIDQAVEMINSSPEPPMETPTRRQAFESFENKPKASKQRLSKRRAQAKKSSLMRRNSVATVPSIDSRESFHSTEDGSFSDDAFADDESCISGNSLDTTSNGNKHRRNSGPLKKSARPSVRQRLHEQPNVPMVTPQPPTPEPVEKILTPEKHKESDVKTAVPNNTLPKNKQHNVDLATPGSKTPRLNKYESSKQLVQPTSRRVNGVTLRDLYSLRAVLSDSDNGTVFSGRRRIDNAAVAIKRIMKNKVKRWHNIKEKQVPMEIALLRRVNEQRHPGVNNLLEWFECADCFLLVMARPTPVLDLFDFVSERKRLDEDTSKAIIYQIIEAVNHCHNRGVLHRDIKLENILVKTDTLTTTIIDFGCGTQIHNNLYKDFAGTPQYYPPEYYMTKQYYGLHATVWSLGITLYAMLCGRLPFASAHEIVHLEPSWHGSFCRKISSQAKDLVEQMLKKQPKKRMHINDIAKHKWLRNVKYNQLTGEVIVLPEKTSTAIIQSSSLDRRTKPSHPAV